MSLRTARFDFDDGGTYVGQWYQGCAHGLGLATGPNGIGEYSGQWESGFETCGLYVWPSGNVYAGTWAKGKRHGCGRQIRGKWVYQGQFTAGACGPCGVKALCNSQSMYEGSWCFNRFEGYGIETCADGSIYAGSWSKGLRHGFGVRRSYVRVPMNSGEEKKTSLDNLLSTLVSGGANNMSPSGIAYEDKTKETAISNQARTVQGDNRPNSGVSSDSERASRKAQIGRAIMRRLRKQHSALELGCSVNTIISETTAAAITKSNLSTPPLITANHSRQLRSFEAQGSFGTTNETSLHQENSTSECRPSSTTVTDVTATRSTTTSITTNKENWITLVEIYAGEWVEDKRTGFGIMERSNGYRYIGEWLQNQRHGYGVVHHPDGTQEEGQFQANQIATRLNRKSKLQILRQTKLKEYVENAIVRATDAAKEAKHKATKMAQEKAKLARKAANAAEEHLLKARYFSQQARELVRQTDPQFHQPGLEWVTKHQSENISNLRPLGTPSEQMPSNINDSVTADDPARPSLDSTSSTALLPSSLATHCSSVVSNPKIVSNKEVKLSDMITELGQPKSLSCSSNAYSTIGQLWRSKVRKTTNDRLLSLDSSSNSPEHQFAPFLDTYERFARIGNPKVSITPKGLTRSTSTPDDYYCCPETGLDGEDVVRLTSPKRMDVERRISTVREVSNEDAETLQNLNDQNSSCISKSSTVSFQSRQLGFTMSRPFIQSPDDAQASISLGRSPSVSSECDPAINQLQHLSRLDTSPLDDQIQDQTCPMIMESRRTGSRDSSLYCSRDTPITPNWPDAIGTGEILTTARNTYLDRWYVLSPSMNNLHKIPPTEKVHLNQATYQHKLERGISKPVPSKLALSIENTHAPKLGSQHTQDSGYLSLDPSDSRSLPSRGLNHSISRQISQPVKELEESQLDAVLSDGEKVFGEIRMKYDKQSHAHGVSAGTFLDPFCTSVNAKPVSLQVNQGYARFSSPIAKKARGQIADVRTSHIGGRRYLCPKRRFQPSRSKSGHTFSRGELHSSEKIQETPRVWASHRDSSAFQPLRPYQTCAPEPTEFVRMALPSSLRKHVAHRRNHSNLFPEPVQFSDGEGLSDHSEYSMATVRSAPLYQSHCYSHGTPVPTSSIWSSPESAFHRNRRILSPYRIRRGLVKAPVVLHPYTKWEDSVHHTKQQHSFPVTSVEQIDPGSYAQTIMDSRFSNSDQFPQCRNYSQPLFFTTETNPERCVRIPCVGEAESLYAPHVYTGTTQTSTFLTQPLTPLILPNSNSMIQHMQASDLDKTDWFNQKKFMNMEYSCKEHDMVNSKSTMESVITHTMAQPTMNSAVQVNETTLNSPCFAYVSNVGLNSTIEDQIDDSWCSDLPIDHSPTSIQPDSNPYNYSNIALINVPSTKVMHDHLIGHLSLNTENWQSDPSNATMTTGLPDHYINSASVGKSFSRRVSWPPRKKTHPDSVSSKVTSRRNSEHSNSSATIIASKPSPIPSFINQRYLISQGSVAATEKTKKGNWFEVLVFGQTVVLKSFRYCIKLLQQFVSLAPRITEWISQNIASISILLLNLVIILLCVIIYRLLRFSELRDKE